MEEETRRSHGFHLPDSTLFFFQTPPSFPHSVPPSLLQCFFSPTVFLPTVRRGQLYHDRIANLGPERGPPPPFNIPHDQVLVSWTSWLCLLRCSWPCVVWNYEKLSMKRNQHEALESLVLPGLNIAKNITLLLWKENSWKESCCKVLGVH